MKFLFFSDLHGAVAPLKKLQDAIARLQPDLLVFLGDALYHGPRNLIPESYQPQEVAAILNSYSKNLVAVRGNCDAEVDQMLLKFPISESSAQLFDQGRRFFLTHGHLAVPELPGGTIIVRGHTHITELSTEADGTIYFNPGSVSLPKNQLPASFGFYDGKKLSIHLLDSLRPITALDLN